MSGFLVSALGGCGKVGVTDIGRTRAAFATSRKRVRTTRIADDDLNAHP
jgi:hypothetical protein